MNRKLLKLVLIIGVAAVVVTGVLRIIVNNSSRKTTVITSSTLTKAIDIAELSTAEFTYTGIAEAYSDEARTNVRCRILYSANVKAGINMNDVIFDVNKDTKVVTATLPEISLKTSINEEIPMHFLPSDADLRPEDTVQWSTLDAEKEANESGELKKVARENLEATIKGLLLPLLKPQGYTLVFN